MNIMITGVSGQLGAELKHILSCGRAEIGTISSAYDDAVLFCPTSTELDISNEEKVREYFADHEIDLVINCAGYTNVDACETDEDAAYAVNALGPEYLARAAEKVQAKMVHVSTDYVFSGTAARPRVESDQVKPLSAYGRTKLAGEQAVQKNCTRFFIVRTAWLYGYNGKNFVKTMLSLGENHDKVSVVADQIGNPTSANDLAYVILKLALTDGYGVYHVTNEGECAWSEFAAAIMKGAHLSCMVEPVSSAQWKQINPAAADRPAFSSLKNKGLEDTIGNEMRPWRQALDSYLANYDNRVK